MDTFIRTVSGRMLDVLAPDPALIQPYDIAVGLSNCCRFVGQVEDFYSVAQHAVMVSHLVPACDAFEALNHDDPEAYIHDITSPLKKCLPDYKLIENRWWEAICRRFNLNPGLSPAVKAADALALAVEDRDLRLIPAKISIPAGLCVKEALTPRAARKLFIDRFCELTRCDRWRVFGANA